MSDSGEQQSLLQKDSTEGSSKGKSSFNYLFKQRENLPFLNEVNWTDSDSSSCSSYYSDCHSSSFAEWEKEIYPNGDLFYIESYMQPKQYMKSSPLESQYLNDDNSCNISDSKMKTTKKGKLVRLIRRRSSRRSTRKKLRDNSNQEGTDTSFCKTGGSKVTFKESQEGESREVLLQVTSEGVSLGRRATPAESLLGLVLSTLSDKTRIMVAGFIPNSQSSKERNIKVGDWLKNINGEEVTSETLNAVLNQISPPCEVVLTLQRVAECDITLPTTSLEIQDKVTTEQSELVKQIVYGFTNCEKSLFSVLYITQEGVTEGGPADQGLVYCYPRQDNAVCSARGAFVTIDHLLPDLTKSAPVSTTIKYEDQFAHIIYNSEDNKLFLFTVPNNRCTIKEAILLNNDIVRNLKFTYQTLSRCFTKKENHCDLDRFFSLLQAQFLLPSTISLQRLEDLLPAAHLIALPRDAQVQIDDALSELESNDFGGYNVNDDSQRLYSIIGSCLFYKGYLLASHLSKEDLMDVNSFCRHNGLLSLNRTESVKNIVIWKEVYPASCNRGIPALTLTYFLPQGRWFLALVGQNESLLAILLESGGCTLKFEGNPGPEPAYIKQAQATLQHMKEIEVLSLADKWICNHCRIHTVSPDNQFKSSARVSTDNNNSGSVDFSPKSSSSPGSKIKSQEVTSILKQTSIQDESFSSSGQYETSEDSTSQAASSVISDEAAPILGRRAERERASDSRHSDSQSDFSSDSDWNSFKEYYQSSSGSRLFDLSELGKNLLSDIEYSPMKLTAGEQNTLFHYVQLDCTEGVVMCSPNDTNSGRLKLILDNFRVMAPIIHDLLQNTVRFKKLKVQEVPECLINKTLIANKEHAMLFECPPSKSDTSKKCSTLSYWVVGRLFFMPQPREVYVCYQDSSPQNLVEIAFRLALSASG